jgi:hypothetical protein
MEMILILSYDVIRQRTTTFYINLVKFGSTTQIDSGLFVSDNKISVARHNILFRMTPNSYFM